MINENKGQVSIEYLLIFSISIIILLLFTLPLAEITTKNYFDLKEATSTKFQLSKIANTIDQVTAEGQGSKKTVILLLDRNISVLLSKNQLITNLILNDGKIKEIKIQYNNNLSTSLNLEKGKNLIVIHWPINSNNIEIYRK